MLWKICLKRFRWFIYCLILAVLFALPAALGNGESGGAFGAIAFFIFVPAAFVAFVWAVYAAVRDVVNVRKGGALPEDKPSVVSTAAGKLRDEAAVVNELDSHGRTKYFILRILGVLLVVGGIALIIKDAVVIGTIVLIAGGALWIAASPKSFNETTDGMKMVTCPKEMTVEELYRGNPRHEHRASARHISAGSRPSRATLSSSDPTPTAGLHMFTSLSTAGASMPR